MVFALLVTLSVPIMLQMGRSTRWCSNVLRSAANEHVFNKASNLDTPAVTSSPVPLKFQLRQWLRYAAADAVHHGISISEDCEQVLGAGFVQRFAQSRGELCGAGTAGSAGSPLSQVDCYAYPVRSTGMACQSKNAVLNISSFMGPYPPVGAGEHHKYLPVGATGSLQLDCRLLGPEDDGGHAFPSWKTIGVMGIEKEQLPWFKSAPKQVNSQAIGEACQKTTGNVVQHPVLFVSRLDPTNPYHHTQSIVQAFLNLLMLEDTTAAHTSPTFTDLQVC